MTTPSFAEIGRAAARAAQREALLATLEACGWNLTATAKALRMGGSRNVKRAMDDLGLQAIHAAMKANRIIRVGRPNRATLDRVSEAA